MQKALTVALVSLFTTACLQPGKPVLARQDDTPPQVLSTTPAPLDAGYPVIPTSTVLEVTFSKDLDLETLRPGILLYQGEQQLPLIISVPPPTGVPDFAVASFAPYTVQLQQASGGSPCQPDGGTTGCLMSTSGSIVYTLQVLTLVTDNAGNALPAELQVYFGTQ